VRLTHLPAGTGLVELAELVPELPEPLEPLPEEPLEPLPEEPLLPPEESPPLLDDDSLDGLELSDEPPFGLGDE
jgi:hypothetical protein